MATYFHGSSDIQGDGLQTLYLMNPNYVSQFSDTHQQPPAPNNMLLLNSAGNALNPSNISHAPPPHHTQHFVGIPLPPASIGSPNSDDSNRPSWHTHHEIPTAQLHGIIPRFHYNLWGGSIDQSGATGTNLNAATAAGSSCGTIDISSQLGFRRPAVSPTQQGNLSLSLSPQQPTYNRSSSMSLHADHVNPMPAPAISPAASGGGEDMRVVPGGCSPSTTVSNGISGMQSFIFDSKYLKAAQQLLDEVVNVGKGIKSDSVEEGTKEKIKINRESIAVTENGSSGGDQSSTKHGAELTTAQRQELQMKKAKLGSMFDEVEQRYRQYHHQMQVVITSFQQAAGFGSAKSYTALALQTISKQFRCLKDAISAQIKATSKSLGEEDCLGVKVEGSRLRLVDHQLRQQRALQQLGMIQHNAWRPQRGLPERAVSVLRAWLFEHFLHPYPKDSDKHMLAKQTGLTRSQVSNWFINARVRLWKPMVEEMYLEEIKDRELQNGSNDNTTTKSETNKDSGPKSSAQQDSSQIGILLDQAKTLQSNKQEKPTIYQQTSPTEISNSTMSTSPMGGSIQAQSGFNLASSSDLEGIIVHRSPKKPRSNDLQNNSPSSILSMEMDMKPSGHDTSRERQTRDGYDLLMNNGSGFGGAYNSVGEMGRFDPTEQLTPRFHGNGVSLTLGLPHCENLSLSGTQQNYLSNQNIQLGRRLKMGTGEPDFLWY